MKLSPQGLLIPLQDVHTLELVLALATEIQRPECHTCEVLYVGRGLVCGDHAPYDRVSRDAEDLRQALADAFNRMSAKAQHAYEAARPAQGQ